MSAHPGAEDLPYLRSSFVPLDVLARTHGHDPADVRRAIADRAGSFEALPAWFAQAYDKAAARYPAAGTAEEQWEEYLGGIYAVCLRAVTPASIVAKGELMDTIERLTADPAPDDDHWRRFGPTSRDNCITAVRERFGLDQPEVAVER